MFHQFILNLLGADALTRSAPKGKMVAALLAAGLSLPAFAQRPVYPTETGRQRVMEQKADRVTEPDTEQACQDAHAVYPAPQHFAATAVPSGTPAGMVNLVWTPVPGLDPSVSYGIQYEINGTFFDVRADLAYNASSFVASNLPVWYPLKFSIFTVKRITAGIRLANGSTRSTHIACAGQVAYSNPPVVVPTTSAKLIGFVDLHTHPMSNLGFGGKLIYGGVDVGSLLPADPDCHYRVRATSEQQALGHDKSTHGGVNFLNPLDNPCGDAIREQVIHAIQAFPANDPPGDAEGYPNFNSWPKWNDLTHQKMWVEWIRRAYTGGLRVMVALATTNKTLGDMTAGPGDFPTDDKSSVDLQIAELKDFVRRHSDFMEIAYSSADLYRIVSAPKPKLAVIMGIEVDHLGNLATSGIPTLSFPDAVVKAEIDRLYDEGVRYLFPIHLLDNAFGGAAAYNSLFDASNFRETGHPWDLVCASDRNDIDIHDQAGGGFTYDNNGLTLLNVLVQLHKTGFAVTSIQSPQCPSGFGQKNRLGLTATGIVAIKEMMRLGMLIDIDHMSQVAADTTLQMAAYAGYPVNSGHNALRGAVPTNFTERALRADQYAIIGRLHGMAGVGSANVDAVHWVDVYGKVAQAMGGSGIAAGLGTDMNGMEYGMPPSAGAAQRVQYTPSFPACRDGNKTWFYDRDGVAHYGMLWDFLQDVKALSPGTFNNLMTGADYLFHTWQIAEARSATAAQVTFPPASQPPPAMKISIQSGSEGVAPRQMQWVIVTAVDNQTGKPVNGSVTIGSYSESEPAYTDSSGKVHRSGQQVSTAGKTCAPPRALCNSGSTGTKIYYSCGKSGDCILSVDAPGYTEADITLRQ